MYEQIIIGAGIGGLSLGYELLKNKKTNFIILEQKGRIGGRIKSIKLNKNIIYDSGALRISNKHFNMLNLLNELNLDKYLVNFNPNTKYFINNKKGIRKNIQLDNLIKKISILPIKTQQSNTVEGLSYLLNENNKFKTAMTKLGYNHSLTVENAYDFIRKYFNYHGKYYRLECGLSEICNRLLKKIGEKNLIRKTILKDFKYIDKKFIIYTNNGIYKCNKLILAIPKESLLNIKSLENCYNLFKSVTTNNYMRIYAIYPFNKYGKVWFDDIDKIITDLPIRKIVPIDKSKGLIQISYSDGNNADIFDNANINQNLKNMIKINLNKIFPNKKIPKPIYLRAHYWDSGTHFWKPHINSKKMSKIIRNPIPNIPLYILGESYSMCQGWMEGALISSKKVLKLLLDNKITSRKYFTIKEVSRHNKINDAWIIYNNIVYDITKWISKHPGGNVILLGLGKDITNLFDSSGHSDNALNVMSNYKIGYIK